jgi:hypothetical protein
MNKKLLEGLKDETLIALENDLSYNLIFANDDEKNTDDMKDALNRIRLVKMERKQILKN